MRVTRHGPPPTQRSTALAAAGTAPREAKLKTSFATKYVYVMWFIVLCDPHRAVIAGPSPLHGGVVESPDIRAGMAMLLAALAAHGDSVIHNIGQIERGYERIDERLRAVGAQIERREG